MIKEIKEMELENILKENKKVVLDCYAPWCGPCRMLSPIMEEIALENKDICFIKTNIDENEALANQYRIMSIPTLLIFEDGNLKNTIIGLKSKEELLESIK